MNAMQVQAIANLVNFAIFLFILFKWALPAAKQVIRDRHAAIVELVRHADETHQRANEALSQTQSRLAGVDAELNNLVSQAKQLASAQAAEVESNAKADAERLRAQAKAEIERERQAAVEEIRQLMLNQAFERVTAELQSSMTPERQRELVNSLVQKVGDGSLALK
jgi:F-type H+-transporting ATPase subunit b